MKLINLILRRIFTGTFKNRDCDHLDQMQDVTPEANVCTKCVELGDTWPCLRLYLTCCQICYQGQTGPG